MIILGIDPGLASCGYGIIEICNNEIKYKNHGCIITEKGVSLSERIFEIYSDFLYVLDQYNPDYIGIEDIFFCKNVTSAMSVGQVKGALLLMAKQHNIPIKELNPLEIKQSVVGYGKADKIQVQRMVQTILSLNNLPQPHHSADALAVAICCSQYIKFNSVNVSD